MSWERPCPVCGATMSCHTDYIEGALCEIRQACSRGCYLFEFAYGSTRICISDVELIGWHADPEEKQAKMRADEKAAIEELKRKKGVK